MGECADKSNKGRYFGIFFSIMNISVIVGCLIATFVFSRYNVTSFFALMAFLSILGSLLVLTIKNPEIMMEEKRKLLEENML